MSGGAVCGAHLEAALIAGGVRDGRCDLADVWPVLARWFGTPVVGGEGRLAFECIGFGDARDRIIEPPDGLPAGGVIGLGAFREVAGGPNVGLGLYSALDDDWRALTGAVDPGQPFVEEIWRDGLVAPRGFLEHVEASPYFALALRKDALMTAIIDTDVPDARRFAAR